jgi:hypothetical protein
MPQHQSSEVPSDRITAAGSDVRTTQAMIECELCLVRSRAKVPVDDIVSQAHQAKAQPAEVLVDEEANVVQAGWSRDADTPRDEWLLWHYAIRGCS